MKKYAGKFAVMVMVAFLIGSVVLCSSCGKQQLPEKTAKQLGKLLSVMMEQNGIPGAVAGVWIPGKGSWVKTAGKSNVETGENQKADLRFRIGSITKTFTATVVLQLVEEGKMSLDDKLDKYVQGFKYGDRITIRQLCNNTSGIYSYDDSPGFVEETINNQERQWKPEELIELAKTGEPYFEPGTSWRYCNTNFVLLGAIVEKVTGNSMASEIENRITKPLGLNNTFLPENSSLGGPHSEGYVVWAGRWGKPDDGELVDVTSMNPSWAWTAGAMISNLEDLHKWAKALATGSLLSKKMQKERLTWVDCPGGEAIGAKYGLGIFSLGGLIGHDGMLWGYNCGMFYYPEEDATIVVLFNRAMDQQNGEWVSPDLPFTIGAASILFPGKFPWDKK